MTSIDAKELEPKVGHLYKVHGLMNLRYIHGWDSIENYSLFRHSTTLLTNNDLVLALSKDEFPKTASAYHIRENNMLRVLVIKPHMSKVAFLRRVDFCDELFVEITP